MPENYCTVDEIKEIAGDVIPTDDYDDALAVAIARASRAIDGLKKREDGWFVAQTTASLRYYSGRGEDELDIDECVEVTLVEYRSAEATWTEWAAADWVALGPDTTRNTLPIVILKTDPYGDYALFPEGDHNVRVTAKWGYSATVPDVVNGACVAQGLYAFRRAQQAYQDQGGIAEGIVTFARGLCKDAVDLLKLIPDRSRF